MFCFWQGVMSDADFSAIVASIYRTIQDQSHWSEVLEQVARQVGGDKGVIYSSGVSPDDGGLWVVNNIEASSIDRYVRHYGALDAWRLNAEAHGQIDGKIRTGDEVLPRSELYRSEWYNDFCSPLGLENLVHFVQPVTMGGFSPVMHFSVFGGGGRAFDDQTVRGLARYQPHLKQALLLRSLVDERVRVTSAQMLLRAIGDPAILVDRTLRIVAVNDGAAELLRAGIHLRSEKGVLAASPAGRDLPAALNRALRADDQGQPCTLVGGLPGRAACLYNIAPISLDLSEAHRRDHAVVTVRLQRQREADVRLLRDLYGLTETEVKVARELVSGAQVRDISEKWRVSQETVRSHVKSILGKTGCRRQGDLIRLVWSNFAAPCSSSPKWVMPEETAARRLRGLHTSRRRVETSFRGEWQQIQGMTLPREDTHAC
jgi:DNA-binding CsgD family transcriptional regulator